MNGPRNDISREKIPGDEIDMTRFRRTPFDCALTAVLAWLHAAMWAAVNVILWRSFQEYDGISRAAAVLGLALAAAFAVYWTRRVRRARREQEDQKIE